MSNICSGMCATWAPDLSAWSILLLSGLADRNLAALSDGHVDATITADIDTEGPEMHAIPLLRERLIIVAPPDMAADSLARMAEAKPYFGFVSTAQPGTTTSVRSLSKMGRRSSSHAVLI